MSNLAAIFVIGLIVFGIYGLIHSSHDNWYPLSGKTLDRNAVITGVKTSRYNKYKFKTVVTFSDGFRYTAFDTKSSYSGFNKQTIQVTPEMKVAIAERAQKKHNDLLSNPQNNSTINQRNAEGPPAKRNDPQRNQSPASPVQAGTHHQKMSVPPLRNPVRKGQKVPLESTKRLTRVKACMGWNVQNPVCEVDVSAFLLQNEKVPGDDWFVFYGQDRSPDNSVQFHAEAQPDREMITLDFSRINPGVDKIVFILTINEALEKRLNFSMLADTYIRLLDANTNQELLSFQIDEYYANVTSMMIGEVYRHNGAWKFNAIGNGVSKDLAGLCQMYGVQVV